MTKGKALPALLLAVILGLLLLAQEALAVAPKPAWAIQSLAEPTNFKPGEESGKDRYEVIVTNSGGKVTNGTPITIIDTLPKGIGVQSLELLINHSEERSEKYSADIPGVTAAACKPATTEEVTSVTCTIEESLAKVEEAAIVQPQARLLLVIRVKVPPTASGPLANEVEVSGGGAEATSIVGHNEASAAETPAGFQEFDSALLGPDGKPTTGADSHPYAYSNSFAVNTELAPAGSSAPLRPAEGDLKDIEVPLPAGLIGNPTATARCTAAQFNTIESTAIGGVSGLSFNECPTASAVGVIAVEQLEGGTEGFGLLPLYDLVPPKGMPAQLGFQILGLPIYIDAKLRSESDYGITGYLQNISEAKRVTAAKVTIWGTPWAQGHDRLRGRCAQLTPVGLDFSCPAEAGSPRPFFRLPSSCDATLPFSMRFDTWLHPGVFQEAGIEEPAPTECDLPDFSPQITAKPTTDVADAPSGLDFDLHLPQAENEDPEGLGEADLREAKVTLPEGFVVNPSSADGLGACSPSEIGLTTAVGQAPAHFTADSPNCPDASKVGSVEVDTPLADHPLPGAVYLAQPHANPFDSLLAIYIAVSDPQTGVVVKLPGRVEPDPLTGTLTTTVSDSPQTPFEDFKLRFFEGARAPLRTPAVCGMHTTTTSLTPWTAPASGPAATPSDSFETTRSPSGGTCPGSAAALPNAPSFQAGTETPIAGAYSTFVAHLARPDGSQELKGLNLTLPPGMAAKFAGVAECSDASIAAAEAMSGRQQQSAPSCPAASHVGSVTVGAGAGPAPFYAKGDVYLAGPYRGAPLSMAIITPAVAGPFDLGDVVVRAPLFVNPETAQGTVRSSFPTILQGIPLDVRSIAVRIDRQGFTLNPTSCEAKAVIGEAISVVGQSVPLSNRFQVGGCENLGFKPKLSLKLQGGTKRGGHPSLLAAVTYPKGGAYSNIAYAQVALPHSEFLDQAHIGTVCTRVQFAAHQCPARSVYGFARAITPLFDRPLEGPVYLRSSSHQLPDLVADLNGQVEIALDGKTDSVHGGLRNTFEAVPDAPVTKFILKLAGAKKGLLQNSTDICKGTHNALARFVAQNGKVSVTKPQLQARCGGRAHGRKSRRR